MYNYIIIEYHPSNLLLCSFNLKWKNCKSCFHSSDMISLNLDLVVLVTHLLSPLFYTINGHRGHVGARLG